MVLSIVLAVLAAGANAAASVLQRKADREEPEDRSGLAMLWDLAHRPGWIAGIAAVIVGFLLQAGALATGPIALVQPILVLELGFTMLLASAVFHSRLHRREWAAVIGMSIGLTVLLFSLQPSGGRPGEAPLLAWALGTASTLAIIGVLVGLAHRRRDAARAALLGVATGMGFGFTATLVAAVTAAYAAHQLRGVFTAWQTYVLIVVGPLFFFLLQRALQAGRLVASQPALTLSNPILAFVFGIVVFGEQVRGGGWLALAFFGAALIGTSTVVLARSPMLQGSGGRSEEPAQRRSDPNAVASSNGG
jgi:drug/metabolite transporter (DMT)-like permease